MAATALKCPFCGSEDVRKHGASNGKKRYAFNNFILFP
jgi:transposase-like protein